MRGRWLTAVGASGIALAASCSPNFSAKTCATDSDCGSLVCEMSGGQAACVSPASAPIHVGMSAPISGPNQELGTDMKLGVTLAFDAQNAAGGIRGRSDRPRLPRRSVRAGSRRAGGACAGRTSRRRRSLRAARRRTTPPSPARRGSPRRRSIAGKTRSSRSSATSARPRWCARRRCRSRRARSSSAPSPARRRSCATRRPDPAPSTCSTCGRAMRTKRARRSSTSSSRTCPTTSTSSASIRTTRSGRPATAGSSPRTRPSRAASVRPPIRPTRSPASGTRATTRRACPRRSQGAADVPGAAPRAPTPAPHTVGVMMTDTYGAAVDFITGLRQWQYANDAQQASLQKATRLTLLFSNVSFVGPNALAQGLKSAGTVAGPDGARAVYRTTSSSRRSCRTTRPIRATSSARTAGSSAARRRPRASRRSRATSTPASSSRR